MWTMSPYLIAGSLFAIPAEARADGVAIAEKPGHITEATVVVDATPAEIYALVTDYAQWRSVLSDVTSVTVTSGARRNARVLFRSRALAHEVTVVFDNVANDTIRFKGVDGPPGGRASGTYVLRPIDGGRRTQVTARLYLDVVGVPGMFVRDSTLRSMRQAKLRADLMDVAHRFATRDASARP
jgi:uncharacterized membrane protein